MPVAIVWNRGKLCPFVGVEIGRNLIPNNEFALGLVNTLETIKDISTLYEAESIINFSSSTVNVNGGVDYVFSPRIKLRLQYSMGLNDFVTHRISTMIVDGVNMNGTTFQSNRVNKLQLTAIYIPDWKKNKKNRQMQKAERPSFKERIKLFYE
ncbi:MAG TPA: hypothetical protein VJY41_05980 [Prolixibacteraceae bacterium]|nr:hypothetical protein [Prolixibacteraceae bacterium]